MAFGSALNPANDTHKQRKDRGAFFTPPELASYLAEFAVRTSEDWILEPSCGEGEFLLAAADRLKALGADHQAIDRQLEGCELHQETAKEALERLAAHGLFPRIICGDFFRQAPSCRFDAVLGNPPYIRFQQFSGEERALARQDALRAGVNIDAQASAWAPFIVHASLFLRVGGRMAFVLPAELLSTNYAAPVRRYLLEHFAGVQLILFEQSVFPEVQEEVVLLMADGFRTGSTETIGLQQLFSVQDLHRGNHRTVQVDVDDRWPVGHWGKEASDLLASIDSNKFTRLGEWGDIRLGAVTGNNAFFALTIDDVQKLGLEVGRDVISLCPPGSRHLRQLDFDAREWNSLAKAGKRVYLFYPKGSVSSAAQAYIDYGENKGVNDAYKCRVRSPWWHVPGVKVCDAFFTYMNGSGPNICANTARVAHLNSVHGLFFHDEVREMGVNTLPLLALSTITQLSAEVKGRSYGGGILKLEPREANGMLVPTPNVAQSLVPVVSPHQTEVSSLLASKERGQASKLVDDLLVSEGIVSPDTMKRCFELHERLAMRRKERGASKRVRSKGSNV